jgi:hypothetical protein
MAQPEPEKKPDPKAAPQAAAKPQARPAPGGAGGGRGPSEAYTDMPAFTPNKRKWWPFAVALALAVAGAGIGLKHHAAPAGAPSPLSQNQAVLAFSSQDFDAAATDEAKRLVAAESETHALGGLDKNAPAKTPKAQVAQALAAAPALREGVASGKIGFYTFHLAEMVDEGGDVYDISVDGAPILRLTTSPDMKTVTIPIDVSKPHSVTQTLVFARPRAVYAKNGTGAPPPDKPAISALTIQSSGGEFRGHVASPGQSETWTAQFHGTMGSGGQ